MLMESFKSAKEVMGTQSALTYLALTVCSVVLTLFTAYKFLQSFQQKNYVISDYFKWTIKRNNVYQTRLVMLSLLSFLAFCLISTAFLFVGNDYFTLCGLIFYVAFIFLFVRGERKMENKVPLKFTHRVKRLIATYCVLSFVIFYLLIALSNLLIYNIGNAGKDWRWVFRLRFFAITLFPLLMPFILFISALVNYPFERAFHKRFIIKATQKLDNFKGVKIAVTGSYGKTSVKNFLKDILSQKYNVVATPSSYNTPMGMCLSADLITNETQVFIAEMGARKVGDITELCQMVKPQISVLNGIIGAHLLTFGNIANVIKTKNEIMEYPSVKTGVFTLDNENTLQLYNKFKGEKILCGLSENGDVYADGIKVDRYGSEFTLHVKGQKVCCKTKLLGRHNISNLLLAVAVADKLGLDIEQIKAGISCVSPVEHRLCLIEGDVIVIDDAYNSNAEGAKYALETLSLFEGRKIIVTPGMTELGVEQNKLNYNFGVEIAKVVDYAFLVDGASNNAIRSGMVFGGNFPPENIKMVASLDVAKEKLKDFLKSGDVVLFENDLTDRF